MKKILVLLMICLLGLTTIWSEEPKSIVIDFEGEEYLAFKIKEAKKLKQRLRIAKLFENDASVYAIQKKKWIETAVLIGIGIFVKKSIDGVIVGAVYVKGKELRLF